MPSRTEKVKEKLRPLKTIANYRKIRHEAEDEHARVLADNLTKLREKLRALKFQDLSIVGEIKKVGEAWGMALDLPKGRQLHVRAVKDPAAEGQYILGAHVEAHRNRPRAHLQGDSNHTLGGKLLQGFLKKTKLFQNQRVKFPGKWLKVKVSVDKLLGRKEVEQLYKERAKKQPEE
ncbi:MAG TPA: hypothetical protein VKK79_08625 [Candidatus Lokiarchaeia archaeon]|nr:hypothetical protein [Candidatus Lokiarchaeia archaeon]